jgi:hypothetical protein
MGLELGKRLGQRWPGLKVLYISGDTDDVLKDGGIVGQGLTFLQKPFITAQLLAVARRQLDG